MWIGVLWAGLWVAMWITPVEGKFRHGLLEKSLTGAEPLHLLVSPMPRSAGRPHSTNQKVIQGKGPLHFVPFTGGRLLEQPFSRTLLS